MNGLSLQFSSEFDIEKNILIIGKWLQMVMVTACLQSLVIIDKSEVDAWKKKD